MIWSKNDLEVSHRKQVNSPSNIKLATYLMNFEFQPCGIFEGLSYHQEYESIDHTFFAATIGLVDIIKKFVLSNYMVVVSSVSVIFDTGATYSCSSNKGDFVKLEERTFSRNLKGIEKVLEISGFGIVEYSVRSESGHMIAFQSQAYDVPGLPKDLCIISPQVIHTPERCKVDYIAHFHDEYDSYAELNLK